MVWLIEGVMATRFVNIDYDTPMLLPADLRDWVPEDYLVHFIMEAVGLPDLGTARASTTVARATKAHRRRFVPSGWRTNPRSSPAESRHEKARQA